jgi:signal transduction protein with GAF and PtsI domain
VQTQEEVSNTIKSIIAQAGQPNIMSEQLKAALAAAGSKKAVVNSLQSTLWTLPQTELQPRLKAKVERLAEVQRQLEESKASMPEISQAELGRLQLQLDEVKQRREVWLFTSVVRGAG